MSETIIIKNEKDTKNAEKMSRVEFSFKDDAHNAKKQGKTKTVWVTRSIAEELGREEVLKRTIIEFLIYFLFGTFATIYIIGINTSSAYYLTEGLKQQFVHHQFFTLNNVEITFNDIKTAADFWFYIENHLIDSIFWESTYGTEDELNMTNTMNILYENTVLGVPRMRQVKVRNDSCKIHEYFRKYFLVCFDKYSEVSEDKSPFRFKTGTAWTYSSSKLTKSIPYNGKIAFYDGGGYYINFLTEKEETRTLIQYLMDNIWLTRGTRAVFVDFSVYNANVNLFCIVKLVFEFPTTGGVLPSADFRSLKLLRFHNRWDWFILFCEIVCYLFLIYYILEEIRELVYFRYRYFLRFWNYIDVSIIMLIIVAGILSIFVIIKIPHAIERIKKNPNEYGNLEYLSSLLYRRNNSLAVALYLIYLKLFKFLNFNKKMGQLNSTLNKCALDILGFSMMFFIIFFAYAELGYLLFGNQVENFSTFGIAMFTLLRTILGDFDYQEIEEANRLLAPVYFLSYIFLVFFVLLNMFLAIINDTYSDVKTEIAIAPDELQMSEYVQNKLANVLRKLGCGRFLPKKSEQTNEIDATIRDIREVLKKCGFTDLEIEMFFARYNIDPWADMKVKDSEKLLEELNDVLNKDESNGVQLQDFIRQQERLQEIENSISVLVEQVKILLQRLEHMENISVEKV